MLNLAIQLSTLFSGLLINFVTPAVFGITDYGKFVAINAIVFLIHKTMDIISEPLIKFTDPRHLVFISLALNACVFWIFMIIYGLTWLGTPLLMFSMLLSSSVILSMHALRLKHALLLFQVLVVVIFIALIAQVHMHVLDMPIVRIMEISTLIPGGIAVLYLVIKSGGLPSLGEFTTGFRAVFDALPKLLSLTAVYNIMTNALPLLLTGNLTFAQLGTFRIATSVVQSANALFPINTRAIFTALVNGDARANLWAALSRVSVFYFSLVGIAVLILGILMPALAPYTMLAVVFPTLYWAMLAERHLLADGQEKIVARINLIIGGLVVVIALSIHGLQNALLLYATAFALYALRLAMVNMDAKRSVPLFLLCPVALWLTQTTPWTGVAYLAVAAILQVVWNRLNFQDIKLVWRGI